MFSIHNLTLSIFLIAYGITGIGGPCITEVGCDGSFWNSKSRSHLPIFLYDGSGNSPPRIILYG
jgi:hypothetical protein